jgi:hypothetical protein
VFTALAYTSMAAWPCPPPSTMDGIALAWCFLPDSFHAPPDRSSETHHRCLRLLSSPTLFSEALFSSAMQCRTWRS